MAASDYIDICARFRDQLPAETLANFIASEGSPCDVVDIWDPIRTERYGVRVLRSQIAELRQILKLKPGDRILRTPACDAAVLRSTG